LHLLPEGTDKVIDKIEIEIEIKIEIEIEIMIEIKIEIEIEPCGISGTYFTEEISCVLIDGGA